MSKKRHENYEDCPVEAAVELIGGKWKSILLYRLLMDGKKRFNELRRLHPNITQRMLTRQLRELEKDKLISRKVYAQVPPKVEYELTTYGRTLEPLLIVLADWGIKYVLQKK